MIATREFSILHIKVIAFNITLWFTLRALILHSEGEETPRYPKQSFLHCLL